MKNPLLLLIRTPTALLLITTLQLIGLYNILIGLIGTKITSEQRTPIPKFLRRTGGGAGGLACLEEHQLELHENDEDLLRINYEASANQIVIFIIDAMRVDFLTTDYDMPFTKGQLGQDTGHGCLFVSNVKTPTVTLPRIKALVTGDISSYWDIIQNFYSSQLQQDNFIWRIKQETNKTIVFYGDDTWIKLFPTEFDRAEGVASFYVTDFVEVDDNVTRNVNHELDLDKNQTGSTNWDMMILHYLGLDHIGHVHGLREPTLIQSKLYEMDTMIKRIYEALLASSSSGIGSGLSTGMPSYLLVTGDHGMANIGGHGSNSHPEVTTPLIVLSTHPTKPCPSSESRAGIEPLPTVEQIDFATTISALWGLQLPSSSLGKIIPGIMRDKPEELLAALYYNVIHLQRILAGAGSQNLPALQEKCEQLFKEHAEFLKTRRSTTSLLDEQKNTDTAVVEELIHSYQSLLAELSEQATEATVGEPAVSQMLLGLSLLVQAYFLLIICTHTQPVWQWQVISRAKAVLITAGSGSIFLAASSLVQVSLVSIISVTAALASGTLILLWCKSRSEQAARNQFWTLHHHLLPSSTDLQLIHFLSPILIYFSSSFVEEEHFIRYFIWSAVVSLQFLASTAAAELATGCGVKKPQKPLIRQVLILLLSHRAATSWNSTGQKWSSLPSLSLSLEAAVSHWPVISMLGTTLLVCWTRRSSQMNYTFPVSLILVIFVKYLFGKGEGNLAAAYLYPGEHVSFQRICERGALLVVAFELVLSLGRIWRAKRRKGSSINSNSGGASSGVRLQSQVVNCWILLMCLLYRFSNIPLLGLGLVQLEMLRRIMAVDVGVGPASASMDRTHGNKALFYMWFSGAAFYYQGNSNNIATIDVNSGYIGQTTYNELIVGSLIFCHTFSTTILSLLHFLEDLEGSHAETAATAVKERAQPHDGRKLKLPRTRKVDKKSTSTVVDSTLAAQSQSDKSCCCTQPNSCFFYYYYYTCLVWTTGYSSIIYGIVLLLLREHLFIWSVFTPKFLYIIAATLLNWLVLLLIVLIFHFLAIFQFY